MSGESEAAASLAATDAAQGGSAIHIRTARDLLGALRATTLQERARIVTALIHDPSLARTYGAHEGTDVIDELCRQLDRERTPSYVELVVSALALQDDARADRALARHLDDAPTPLALVRIARRLARTNDPASLSALNARAVADAPYDVVLTCARALAVRDDLALRERMRVALVPGGRPDLAPPLDEATRDAWLRELEGPFADEARVLLGAGSPSALALLAPSWSRLAPSTRAWLVAVVADNVQRELLRGALVDPSSFVVVRAIGVARRVAPELLDATLAGDPRRDVRLAFARASRERSDIDPIAAFEAERDADVRIAWVEAASAWKGAPPASTVAALVRWLEADHWSVRAAATSALVRFGPSVTEPLKRAHAELSEAGRVAAAQALMQLGQQEWLEQRSET